MKLQSSFYKVLILFFSAINSSAQITTIGDIPLPEGYKRTEAATNSFGSYLRRIQLKKDKTVYLYDGKKKANQSVQYAVLNVSIGLKDLQQCADAVMRLRAEYLRSKICLFVLLIMQINNTVGINISTKGGNLI